MLSESLFFFLLIIDIAMRLIRIFLIYFYISWTVHLSN